MEFSIGNKVNDGSDLPNRIDLLYRNNKICDSTHNAFFSKSNKERKEWLTTINKKMLSGNENLSFEELQMAAASIEFAWSKDPRKQCVDEIIQKTSWDYIFLDSFCEKINEVGLLVDSKLVPYNKKLRDELGFKKIDGIYKIGEYRIYVMRKFIKGDGGYQTYAKMEIVKQIKNFINSPISQTILVVQLDTFKNRIRDEIDTEFKEYIGDRLFVVSSSENELIDLRDKLLSLN